MDPGFIEKVQAMASFGISRTAIAAFANTFLPELHPDDRRFLGGPLIIHLNGWTDTLPTWLSDAVTAERVGIVFGLTPQYIVGPAEIASVMYPATLAHPLERDFGELYLWATMTAHAAKLGSPVGPLWDTLMHMRPIEDAEVLERGGRLHETYRNLATDVRRKVIAAQAAREREARAETKAAAPAATPAPVPPSAFTQRFLFDLGEAA